MDLSIVIPCYNEEEGIPNLARQLDPVVKELQKKNKIELIFVDDGSSDKTSTLLKKYFKHAVILRHKKNMNLGAALRTGFNYASGNLVAALDSDCTYNPKLLPELLSNMGDADIITVSPYHPKGIVENVPGYRLFLSKGVTWCYRLLLGKKVYTITAMVRVYKKKVIKSISFKSNSFLGGTELLVKAMLKGYKLKELPATLEARKFGVSKMKTLEVALQHLGFLGKLALYKILRVPL